MRSRERIEKNGRSAPSPVSLRGARAFAPCTAGDRFDSSEKQAAGTAQALFDRLSVRQAKTWEPANKGWCRELLASNGDRVRRERWRHPANPSGSLDSRNARHALAGSAVYFFEI
jgi:hypothetical protein